MSHHRCALALAGFVLVLAVSMSGAQTPPPVPTPEVQTTPSDQQPQPGDVEMPSPVPAAVQTAPSNQNPPPAGQLQVQGKGDLGQDIETNCHFNLSETDAKKIRKASACVANAIQVRKERLQLHYRLQAIKQAEAQVAADLTPITSTPRTVGSPNPAPNGGGSGVSPGSPAPGAKPVQNFVGGSLSGTPSTCITGNAISDPAFIRVHRDILTPQTSADDFGYRLGRRFVVYQVTIENGNKDYQFMLQDVSIDFSQQFGAAAGTYKYSASGQDLMLLRGVPEKGEDLDPRNKVLHVLQGIGSVAGAVSGLTSFADVMGPAVAVFNGSFLQGYTTIAPDHTSTQLNRLSDSAFTANTIIDKQRAKTIAMFIPVDELMSAQEQKQFRKDPYSFIGFDFVDGPLSQADICVDGTFIQAVTVAAPTLSSVTFGAGSSTVAGTDAVLNLTGANMVGGDTLLVVSGTPAATAPVTASADGKTGTSQAHLPADFDPTTTTFTLQSKSNATLSSGAGVKLQVAKPAAGPVAPTLIAATLEKTPAPAADSDAILDVTGTNLLDGDTTVLIGGAVAATPVLVKVSAGGKTGTATVHLPKDYVLGTTTATLQSKSTPAMKSAAVKLQVAAAAAPAGVVAPTLSAATLGKTPPPAADGYATLDVTGTNLVDGDTTVVISGAMAATPLPVKVNAGGKAGTATVHLPKDYVLGTTTATLQSKSTPAKKSAAVKLRVAP